MLSSRNRTIDGHIGTRRQIAVDFDATIAISGVKNYPETLHTKLLPYVIEVLTRFYTAGYQLYILTARPNSRPVHEFLRTHSVLDRLISFVTNVKQEATLLIIDDRAYRFDGDWLKAEQDILEILNHHERCRIELEQEQGSSV